MALSPLAEASTPPSQYEWWQQLLIGAGGPVLGALVAALVGGLLVGAILQRLQTRRESEARREHDRQEDQRRREALSLEMMRVAYKFLFLIQESERRRKYGQERRNRILPRPKSGLLLPIDQDYYRSRVDARVIEADLHAHSTGSETARWLWHGAVDTLTARYYEMFQPRRRFVDLVARHGLHKNDEAIPLEVRSKLLSAEEMQDERTRADKLVDLLEDAFSEVIRRKSGPAVLRYSS